MEEYFPPDRLLNLEINSVVHIDREDDKYHFTVSLVGIDNERSVVTTLPHREFISDGASYEEIFPENEMLEMRTIYDGKIIAFESSVIGMYRQQLLISTFPEMIEARRLRQDIRFPCAVSCDIRSPDKSMESYGVITNISMGGAQLTVPKNTEFSFIEMAIESQKALTLEAFFPNEHTPLALAIQVRSAECQIDGACKVGVAFCQQYEPIRKYLESLQLDSVAPFFF